MIDTIIFTNKTEKTNILYIIVYDYNSKEYVLKDMYLNAPDPSFVYPILIELMKKNKI